MRFKRELILGGQKSGKSRRAEMAAAAWLAADAARDAVLIATAQPHDAEMRERIARHQVDRRGARARPAHGGRARLALPGTIAALSAPGTLVVVDCLTLWLRTSRYRCTAPLPMPAMPRHRWSPRCARRADPSCWSATRSAWA